MAYYEIRDWSKGLDYRRLPEATRAGALFAGVNGHITRGGEFEKRKAISELYQLPANCHGLFIGADERHNVWSIAADPGGLDPRVQWNQIVHPTDPLLDINRILSYDDYYSVPYVVIEFEDGSVHHYYDNIRIREDGGLPPDASAAEPPAFGNGRAYTPWFELSLDSVASPTAALDEAWLIPPDQIDTPANWIQINSVVVPYATSAQAWARAIAAEINTVVSVPNVYCEAEDGRVRFSMAEVDAQYNGYMVQLVLTGNAQVLPTRTQSMTFGDQALAPGLPSTLPPENYDYTMRAIFYLQNGVTPRIGLRNPSVAGRPQTLDSIRVNGFSFTVVGEATESIEHPGFWFYANAFPQPDPLLFTEDQEYVAYCSFNVFGNRFGPGTQPLQQEGPAGPVPEPDTGDEPAPVADYSWSPGRFAMVYGAKVYATSGSAVNFSAIGNARVFNPDFAGAGFIDSSIQSSGPKQLVSLAEYGLRQLAFFARRDIQIWSMDPDPERNVLAQVLRNAGTYAARSVTPWGNDVAYLDGPGIRTLRARDSSNAAWVNDIGVPIDTLVQLVSTAAGPLAERAIGAVDPADGRLLMAINQTIFVFSFYPQSRIAAWTIYRPGFRVEEMMAGPDKLYFRSGQSVYALGGETGQEYDSTMVEAELPFLDFDEPATEKVLSGVDCACQGSWTVELAQDPGSPTSRETLASFTNSTFRLQRIGAEGVTTHLALRFTNEAPGPARLGSVVIHYSKGEAG